MPREFSNDLIVVSAFSNPDAVLRDIPPNTDWFYAGCRCEYFFEFKRAFDKRGGKNVVSPRGFHAHVQEMRKPFVEWLEQVHRLFGSDIDHWASGAYRADPYSPQLFIHFCCLTFLRSFFDSSGKRLIVVVESPALATDLAEWARTHNRRFVLCGRANLSAHYWRVIARRLAGYGWQIAGMVLKAFFAGAHRPKRMAAPSLMRPDIVIDAFLHKDSFDENGEFRDRYFPGLQEYAESQGLRVARYAVFAFGGVKSLWRTFKTIRQCRTAFLLIEDFLRAEDYLFAFMLPLRRLFFIFKKRRLPDFCGLQVDRLAYEEDLRQSFLGSGALALLRYRLPLRLRNCGMNPRRYIVWDESQAIHRCGIRGFQKFLSATDVVGVHLNIPPGDAIGHFPTKEKSRHGVSAHRYIVPGRIGEQLIRRYSEHIPVTVGASLIRGPLQRAIKTHRNDPAGGQRKQAHFTTVVALAQNIQESLNMMRIVLPALLKVHGVDHKVLLKPHPDNDVKKYAVSLEKAGIGVGGLLWTTSHLAGLLTETDLLISGFSSAAVEAVCHGVPVLFIANPVGLTLNPLEAVTRDLWREAFDENEFSEIFNDWALKHPLSVQERRVKGAGIAEEFFSENSEENMSKYLTALRGTG